jgi:hypothetical protein
MIQVGPPKESHPYGGSFSIGPMGDQYALSEYLAIGNGEYLTEYLGNGTAGSWTVSPPAAAPAVPSSPNPRSLR